MSAAVMPAGWDGLDELPPVVPLPPPIAAPTPTIYNLHPTTYTLHSTLQVREGENVTPAMRVKALTTLGREDPELAGLYSRQVVPRLNVTDDKRSTALADLVGHLHRAVSGEVAQQLLAIDYLLNQRACNVTLDAHLSAMQRIWDEREQCYPQELLPDERALYEALEGPERVVYRVLRDLAIEGGGEFYMGCDQLSNRVGAGCNGWRMLNQFGPAGYAIIAKSKPGVRREKGVRGRAAYWKWQLKLPPSAVA